MVSECDCDVYAAGGNDEIPYLDVSSVWNEENSELTMFIVNRHLEESIEVDLQLLGFNDTNATLIEHEILTHKDLKACNSIENPNEVAPMKINTSLQALVLEPQSYHMVRIAF